MEPLFDTYEDQDDDALVEDLDDLADLDDLDSCVACSVQPRNELGL